MTGAELAGPGTGARRRWRRHLTMVGIAIAIAIVIFILTVVLRGQSSYGVPPGARLRLKVSYRTVGGEWGANRSSQTYESDEEEFAIDRSDECVLRWWDPTLPANVQRTYTINVIGYRDEVLTIDLCGAAVYGDRRSPYQLFSPKSRTVEIRVGRSGWMKSSGPSGETGIQFAFILPDDHPAMQRERLWEAAAYRDSSTPLRELLAAGQDPLLRDERGTPLDWAIANGAWESALVLCDFAYDTTAPPGFAVYPHQLADISGDLKGGPATRREGVEKLPIGIPEGNQENRQALIKKLVERGLDGPWPVVRGRGR